MAREILITARWDVLVASVAAACLCGSCAREPADEERTITVTIMTSDMASEPPDIAAMPITSCTNLEQREGTLYWKGSDRRFTGRTVLVSPDVDAYRDGKLDLETMTTTATEFYPAEQPFQDAVREQVKKCGLHHNTYFFFQEHGVEQDVPVLLYGLKAMGETTNRGMDCERGHCVDALRKITGTNVGYNYSDWARWWKRKYGTDPVQWTPEREPTP